MLEKVMIKKAMKFDENGMGPTISLEAFALDLSFYVIIPLLDFGSSLHSKNCDLEVQTRGLSFWSATRSSSSNHLHDKQSGRPSTRDCEKD